MVAFVPPDSISLKKLARQSPEKKPRWGVASPAGRVVVSAKPTAKPVLAALPAMETGGVSSVVSLPSLGPSVPRDAGKAKKNILKLG